MEEQDNRTEAALEWATMDQIMNELSKRENERFVFVLEDRGCLSYGSNEMDLIILIKNLTRYYQLHFGDDEDDTPQKNFEDQE